MSRSADRTTKGSLTGGTKTLFQLGPGNARHSRLALTEAPIAMRSALQRSKTCAPTHIMPRLAAGVGPDTTVAIECLLTDMALLPGATLCCATDANRAGNRHAAHHAQLAAGAGVVFERSRPPDLLTGTVSSKRSA